MTLNLQLVLWPSRFATLTVSDTVSAGCQTADTLVRALMCKSVFVGVTVRNLLFLSPTNNSAQPVIVANWLQRRTHAGLWPRPNEVALGGPEAGNPQIMNNPTV
jgi:hypothetical protein